MEDQREMHENTEMNEATAPYIQQPPTPPIPPQILPMPPQGGYGMPPYGWQNSGQSVSDGLAIASMILGIVSILACVWFYVGLPCAIVGLILGCVYRSKGGRSGMSVAGIACSSVGIAFSLFLAFMIFLDFLWLY